MPITYEVLREGRVVLFTYPSGFTMPEVNASIDSFQREVLDKATKKVHTVSDVTAVTQIPPNVLSLSVGMIKKTPTGVGTMFIVTSQNFINSFAGMLTRLFPMQKVVICSTVAEAIEQADRLIAREIGQNQA